MQVIKASPLVTSGQTAFFFVGGVGENPTPHIKEKSCVGEPHPTRKRKKSSLAT